MLKRIILPVLAVLLIACAAGVYLFSVNSPGEIASTVVVTVDDPSEIVAIRFTDSEGNPLPGVMCNVCDETSCTVLTADEEGVARFAGDFRPSKVQVLKGPEGFALPEEDVPLNETGETVIVLEKK